jgi:hypothetical protein
LLLIVVVCAIAVINHVIVIIRECLKICISIWRISSRVTVFMACIQLRNYLKFAGSCFYWCWIITWFFWSFSLFHFMYSLLLINLSWCNIFFIIL